MSKVYHIYCYGYTHTATSAPEAQDFIDSLRVKGCIGQTVTIHVGQGTRECATYPANGLVRTDILTAR